jgi:SH3-like domain-containing protein
MMLQAGTAIRVAAATANHLRVVLDDGRTGWIRAGSVQQLRTALRTLRVKEATPLRFRPRPGGAITGMLPAGASLRVLACSQGWVYGNWEHASGWVAER